MHRRLFAILAVVALLLVLDDIPLVRGQAVHVQAEASATPTQIPSGTAVAEPTVRATVAPTPTTPPTPQATPVNTYVVGPADTLSSIANYFGLTVRQIVELNPGLEVNPDQLFSGDVLAVAPGGTSRLLQARTTPPPAPVVPAFQPSSGILWTFDDCEYAARGNVSAILAVLGAFQARAVFFLIGPSSCGSYGSIVVQVQAAGYEIGNHTKSQANLTTLTVAGIDAEILGGPPKSVAPRYFRPPYGARNATVDQEIAKFGYTELLWNASGGDSGGAACGTILYNLVSSIGAAKSKGQQPIVLLHMFNPSTPKAVSAYLSGQSSC